MSTGGIPAEVGELIAAAQRPAASQPWYVLVVDDDETVHSISRFVLSKLRFLNRPVEVLSAYSRRGAAAILWARDDVAVVLLDVAMEEGDAGVRLVREIRDEMRNAALRIMLRGAGNGHAPDPEMIVDYDIIEYQSKADLTAPKLLASTLAALRAFSDHAGARRSSLGLELAVSDQPQRFERPKLDGFALTLLQQAAELLGGENDGALIVPDPRTGEARVAAAIGSFSQAAGLKASLLPTGVAEYVERAMRETGSLTDQHLIIRPIRTAMQQSGVLLFRPSAPPTRDNLALLDILCASVGVGLDNVYLYRYLLDQQASLESTELARTGELTKQRLLQEELRVAGTLQQSILPAEFPDHPRMTGAAMMRAARDIGGDFYDIFEFDEDHIGLVVADVSGKGVPAALFMVLVRTILQDVVRDTLSPAKALAETNRRLLERNPLSLFVTIIYGVLDTRTGSFTFCSGGHGMPYICRADGRVEKLGFRSSPLVGLLDMARYVEHEETLGPGDSVVMTTDGVEEAHNAADELFGDLRLHNSLEDALGEEPADVMAGVVRAVERFAGGTPPFDDLTCMVVRWEGTRRKRRTLR